MKTALRIALAPVMLAIRLMLGLAAFLTSIASSVLGLFVSLFGLLAVIEFFIGYCALARAMAMNAGRKDTTPMRWQAR